MNLNRYCTCRWSVCALFSTIVYYFLSLGSAVHADPAKMPEPGPPLIDYGIPENDVRRTLFRSAVPDQEWTYHKTADDLHPDGNEQQMVWLMNRARFNPSQEGAWLADTGDPSVENVIDYWGVDVGILQDEFDGYDAAPPAAFDVRLYNAARAHSEDLIARDSQDHTGQFDRVDESGFIYTRSRGNVFSYTNSALYGHAAFNIDWGNDGGDGSGMQPSRGHRLAIMAIDYDYTNVGLAMVADTDPGTGVGPLVTTGNFCFANTGAADHFNRFLVGTVWQDVNDNERYDPGEGMAGITVMPDQGAYYAVTANSGGYAFPILSAGNYTVSFFGPGVSPTEIRKAVVGAESVLLDLLYSPGTNSPQAITGSASDVSTASANLNGMVYTNGQDTEYYFEYGTTASYGSETANQSIATDGSVAAVINGLTEDITYHFRLAASNTDGTSLGADQTFRTSASTPQYDDSTGTPAALDPVSGGGCFIAIAVE